MNNYSAFIEAAASGDLPTLQSVIGSQNTQYLADKLIWHNEFKVFKKALEHGQIIVLEWLLEKYPQHREVMFGYVKQITADRHRCESNPDIYFPLIYFFTQFHEIFASIELLNYSRYDLMLAEVVRNTAVGLDELASSELAKIDDPEKISLYFYMVRYCIRVNTYESLRDLKCFLQVPGLQRILAEGGASNNSNELLRLAIKMKNEEAIQALLRIPAVRDLAAQNNYYNLYKKKEVNQTIRKIAADRESAVHKNSLLEESYLEDAKNHYLPRIEEMGGFDYVFENLKTELRQLYEQSPAVLRTGDGREILLPFEWNIFKDLCFQLSEDSVERAKQAYYQHKIHTAARYFMKPNFWANPTSVGAVEVEGGVCSYFESYKELICLLFVAVTDTQLPDIDGFGSSARFSHFISEIAHIARAHNWDKVKRNPITRKKEEYDDLQPDNGSCYSGINKRLIQSVVAHPLFTILTKEQIRIYYIYPAIFSYFKSIISYKNAQRLLEAWRSFYEGNNPAPELLAPLAELNLPPEKVEQIAATMYEELKPSLTKSPELMSFIYQELQPSEGHAIKFGAHINLMSLLQDAVAANPDSSQRLTREELRAARTLFFENSQNVASVVGNKWGGSRTC